MPDETLQTTTKIRLPCTVLAVLRQVATDRANLRGGRVSVSAVLTDLVQRHRDELQRQEQKE